ncbi:MAG: sugar ABC transporter permease [Treponema sp.]|nr:sugar ABC transporter permease [Treponema sp.]
MILIPMLSLFAFSFTPVKVGFQNFRFIGLNNYKSLLQDADFLASFGTTLVLLAGTVFCQMFLGIVFALVINKTKFLTGFVRLIMMFPMVVSPIIVGIIWRTLIMPSFGGFDLALTSLGLPGFPDMLSSPWKARLLIIVAATWEWTPFVILYILAGLEGLSAAPFESAKIDGVNWFQEVFYLTLPMLSKIILVVLIFRIIECMKVFPLIFSLTLGGPGTATQDLTYLVYQSGFRYLKLGYASTVSMFILLLAVVAIVIMGLTTRQKKYKNEVNR